MTQWWTGIALLLLSAGPVQAWTSNPQPPRLAFATSLSAQAGSFFNPVPESNDDEEEGKSSDKESDKPTQPLDALSLNPDTDEEEKEKETSSTEDPFQDSIAELLRQRKQPSLASQPSTINGKPTAGRGFGAAKSSTSSKKKKGQESKPYIGIGPETVSIQNSNQPLNDPTKPEYDDQGYTLYTDNTTGEKSRVFEALVDYPCDFTLKIVGANEGSFVQEMVAVVAESCGVSAEKVPHSVRALGKWMSVTVQAPVESAEMLYQLYENVDRDPRVRFKF
eukprot:CAMPEP_0172441560 /NCGR_PEP_ID=MMETSP1065-20121228/2109_1 /TAXON_ID=265537 /ORGANISM="Amphiprora paludosa, Strain CCMP125" /LENGTH=277 /DNA_ID=CAMNT_0013191011 /DNA_START=195 /DNA_END=1028 /DNA_ORIENTATION=+